MAIILILYIKIPERKRQ